MSTTSSLIAHGGIRRTREELRDLATPTPTRTWRPVPHHSLVEAIIEGLDAQGVAVVQDAYCTAKGDTRLFGTLDLRVPGLDSPDFGMALGLRAGNDKKLSIQVIAAARVFVCSNMAMSGSDGAVFLRRKHTARLDLTGLIPPAIETFLGKAEGFRADIERMRSHPLTDPEAKAILHDLFADRVLPSRLFPVVSGLYFRDVVQRARFPDRTLWSLSNAATEAEKHLRDVPRHEAGLRIGRFFGGLLHRGASEPIAVTGGIEVHD